MQAALESRPVDPDAQVQDTVRLLFETFRRTGSAGQVVRHFAREGLLWPALLQGLVICGRCGDPMTVRNARRQRHPVPDSTCQRRGIAQAQPVRQRVSGASPDAAVAQVVLEAVTPAALDVGLEVFTTAKRFAREGVLRAARADDRGEADGLSMATE